MDDVTEDQVERGGVIFADIDEDAGGAAEGGVGVGDGDGPVGFEDGEGLAPSGVGAGVVGVDAADGVKEVDFGAGPGPAEGVKKFGVGAVPEGGLGLDPLVVFVADAQDEADVGEAALVGGGAFDFVDDGFEEVALADDGLEAVGGFVLGVGVGALGAGGGVAEGVEGLGEVGGGADGGGGDGIEGGADDVAQAVGHAARGLDVAFDLPEFPAIDAAGHEDAEGRKCREVVVIAVVGVGGGFAGEEASAVEEDDVATGVFGGG